MNVDTQSKYLDAKNLEHIEQSNMLLQYNIIRNILISHMLNEKSNLSSKLFEGVKYNAYLNKHIPKVKLLKRTGHKI